MSSAKMFWVDLRVSENKQSSRTLFAKHFSIKSERRGLMIERRRLAVATAPSVDRQGERRLTERDLRIGSNKSAIDICCFEFDYPDLLSLKLLRQTRLRYPRLPILMLTEYHSEALAVWALRLHVWDLLVKPLSPNDIEDVVQAVTLYKRDGARNAHFYDTPTLNCRVPETLRLEPTPSAADVIKPGLAFIHEHFTDKITEKEVAEACGLGTFAFSKTFKKIMGQTFQEYLQQQRITESIRLLQHPSASITDVAYLSGFRDLSYFSKVFKRALGCTPSAFRDNGDPSPQTISLNREESQVLVL